MGRLTGWLWLDIGDWNHLRAIHSHVVHWCGGLGRLRRSMGAPTCGLCGLVSSHSGGLWVVRLYLWWLRTPGSSLLRTRRRLLCLFWPCLRSHAGPFLQHSFDYKKVKSPPRFKGSVHRPHLSIGGESNLYCRKAGGMGIIVAAILGKYSLSHQVFFISRNHSSAFDPLPFSSFPTISPLILQKESRKAVL